MAMNAKTVITPLCLMHAVLSCCHQAVTLHPGRQQHPQRGASQ